MRERPPLTIGIISGMIIGITLMSINIVLISTIRQQAIDMNLYLTGLLLLLMVPLLALWLYNMAEMLTIRYIVGRNGLTIQTLFMRHVIPHHAILDIISGDKVEITDGFRGMSWPGYIRGSARIPRKGNLIAYSTEPLERQLVLVTPERHYGISPKDPQAFMEQYQLRRDLGALEAIPHIQERLFMAAWSIWRDRVFWTAVIIGLTLNALLIGYVVNVYANLPAIIPLHWDAQGMIDRLAPKVWIFMIPFIGTAVLVINTLTGGLLYFRERFGARLLTWAALGIQAAVWLATLEILRP